MATKVASQLVYGDILVDPKGGIYKVAGIYHPHETDDFYTWLIPDGQTGPTVYQWFDVDDEVVFVGAGEIHE